MGLERVYVQVKSDIGHQKLYQSERKIRHSLVEAVQKRDNITSFFETVQQREKKYAIFHSADPSIIADAVWFPKPWRQTEQETNRLLAAYHVRKFRIFFIYRKHQFD